MQARTAENSNSQAAKRAESRGENQVLNSTDTDASRDSLRHEALNTFGQSKHSGAAGGFQETLPPLTLSDDHKFFTGDAGGSLSQAGVPTQGQQLHKSTDNGKTIQNDSSKKSPDMSGKRKTDALNSLVLELKQEEERRFDKEVKDAGALILKHGDFGNGYARQQMQKLFQDTANNGPDAVKHLLESINKQLKESNSSLQLSYDSADFQYPVLGQTAGGIRYHFNLKDSGKTDDRITLDVVTHRMNPNLA